MKIDRDAPVGVFDSGIGGLTVAREIMRNLPAEKIVYFGDTARVPYGSKSRETIIGYSRQIIRFLKEQKVKAIVVACNTASAFALEAVQEEFDIPILGVIEAGAKVAAQVTRNKRVGIIGTEGTVGSGIHAEVLKKIDPEITVIGKPCPLFVPLVEEGWTHDPVTVEVASRYLRELQEKDIDTLILGCTHYPLLRSTIGQIMGDGVTLVNPAYETALELGRLLKEQDMQSTGQGQSDFPYRFYVSDLAEKFKGFANSILPFDVEKTQKIDIEKYGKRERNGKTMEKEVLIHVKGLHMMDTPEGDEPIEIVVPGEYYFRNGSHYLRYEEMLDEQGDPTVNYIKISSRGMEVRKKGQLNTHMVFEQGKRNMAFYTTPFGTLEMGISATNLELEESDGQIAMKVNYSLDLNQEHVADCCLDIQAQGKNTIGFVL